MGLIPADIKAAFWMGQAWYHWRWGCVFLGIALWLWYRWLWPFDKCFAVLALLSFGHGLVCQGLARRVLKK